MKTKLGEYRLQSGGKSEVFLHGPDHQPSEIESAKSADRLALELSVGGLEGIEGYRLTEEQNSVVVDEFCLAPDVMYALFDHFKQIDKTEFPEDYAQG